MVLTLGVHAWLQLHVSGWHIPLSHMLLVHRQIVNSRRHAVDIDSARCVPLWQASSGGHPSRTTVPQGWAHDLRPTYISVQKTLAMHTPYKWA